MARPQKSAKASVNLGSAGPRVSRIRRDPPPVVRKELVVDAQERDQWVVIVGILAFALAIFTIVIAFGSYTHWSPAHYVLQVGCQSAETECG